MVFTPILYYYFCYFNIFIFYPGFYECSYNNNGVKIMLKTKKPRGYIKTHIGTYRYRCLKTKTGYPVRAKGNYESFLSFKELPPFNEMKKNGRKWIYTKNYKPVMDRILLDIDCDGDLEKAFIVTKLIMQDLEDYADCINVYFSGSKGFHIEILTEEIDIIDTTVEKPMYACMQYVEFLNYYQSKFNEVDLSLKDVGTRIIRKHHTKHEKTGNYKILVDINASLEDIQSSSKQDKDMVKPAPDLLYKDKALLLMNTYSKPIETQTEAKTKNLNNTNDTDNSIFALVFNELNTNIHDKIKLLGAGLNGYVDISELEDIYNLLANTTDIESSNNAKQSFIDAYNNDKMPCNIGALKNHYKEHNLDQQNFYKLSDYLDSKLQQKSFTEFNNLFNKYERDWFDMLDTELFDYVDNTENIFNAIIHCTATECGYKKASRFIPVNAGSEIGKSEFIKAIAKLMPGFINLGSSSPATVRRSHKLKFDKKIVYLGDRGLKGQSQASKEEFEGLYEVFGGLITEHEFKRDVMVGDKIMEFDLKSDGVTVFYTQPYTSLKVFGAGDQYSTRSTFLILNPVEDGLSVFLQDSKGKTNTFYELHKNYIKYIINNPLEVVLSEDILKKIYNASKGSLRTAKYLRDLFKGYCQYIRISEPDTEDADKFLEQFAPKRNVSDIEIMVYDKLYDNLKPITIGDIEYKLHEDGSCTTDSMLMQTKNRKMKTFFTPKQIKTYFKNDFKNNKNLKDTIDYIPSILSNLYDAGYLEMLDWQYNGQNVYYMLKKGGDE